MYTEMCLSLSLSLSLQQGANTECLKALIAFGADVNPLNEHGLTPLDLALMSNPSGETV